MPVIIPRTQLKRRAFSARRIQCPYPGCKRWFNSAHSHSFTHSTQSSSACHASVEEIQDEGDTPTAPHKSKSGLIRDYHDLLTGHICDENSNFLDPSTPPPPYIAQSSNNWTLYHNRLEFECAKFLYTKNQMSAGDIDKILHLWGVTLTVHNDNPPFADHKDLYKTIDATLLGDITWQSFSLQYNGDKPAGQCPLWMEQSHEVWFRDPHTVIKNMLANLDFKNSIDYVPYWEFEEKSEQCCYKDFMSGDWAWQQADQIAQDLETHGAAFVPIIVGSDKTTVSVATGQNDDYPLYLSIGNVHNNIWCSHRNALALIGFLAIPKNTCKFKKQLFHSSLSKIFATLKPGMMTPEVTRCGDGHYWHILYGLGPYIANYKEQVVLACIVKDWCGRCLAFPSTLDDGGVSRSRKHTDVLVDSIDFGVLWDEYGIIGDPLQMTFLAPTSMSSLLPNILHQLIKGTFKDHLVEWVCQYLELKHGKTGAKAILDDIDRRIAAAPSFPGLQRFLQGRGFSQWTGDDSKALMKVYIPAIEGHVPDDMVRAFQSLLEFCYIGCTNVVTDETLAQLRDALRRFHRYRTIFETSSVRFDVSLPRQHSLTQYELLICMFGAPNGLCSSIAESKHIKVVKEPWHHLNRYNALHQMLLTNQRLDKIAASRVDFAVCGMLKGSCAFIENQSAISNGDSEVQQNNVHEENNPFASESDNFNDVEDQGIVDDVNHALFVCIKPFIGVFSLTQYSERKHTCTVSGLAHELKVPSLPTLIHLFLYDQIHADDHHSSADVLLCDCPSYMGAIKVFNSAAATFIAPSDPSGITGMRREHIRAVPSWHNGPGHFDCAFVNTDDRQDGILSMDVIQIFCFFSFTFTNSCIYSCALVQWFYRITEERDKVTGMYMVVPSFDEDGSPNMSIIHIDSIVCGAHLLLIFGTQFVPWGLQFHHSLDVFRGFYINRFIDHHSFELAS
ncbi:uncharacterized protein EDB93DRAFT_1241854 [Suillus bovinus]|uniref:uncharacterized protein n=1 Tax=Suillus bovinus TaxID=48563 RepID=UPI001B873483|nr:uncharacterized protein EDB93DRAFT_1241854 [Suillus bovinus]KAG2140490.1 hypothetical protein EDB93DRAFT_1241854 [Suillus bovinus]